MQIIVEVRGGCVQAVYCDKADGVVVDVLDYDCFDDQDCDNSATRYYKTLEEEAKSMTAVY